MQTQLHRERLKQVCIANVNVSLMTHLSSLHLDTWEYFISLTFLFMLQMFSMCFIFWFRMHVPVLFPIFSARVSKWLFCANIRLQSVWHLYILNMMKSIFWHVTHLAFCSYIFLSISNFFSSSIGKSASCSCH